ncbi:hypothetical protein BJF84_26390 [Rhodococcus sp. CUA-806]|nr:hypothetical protein BJF84_26390 [Rhodococcus sp. CUA-806]
MLAVKFLTELPSGSTNRRPSRPYVHSVAAAPCFSPAPSPTAMSMELVVGVKISRDRMPESPGAIPTPMRIAPSSASRARE